MYKYLGEVVEHVLPKLIEERTTDRIPVLGLLTKAVKNRAEDMVGGAVDSAVDRLTKDGLVEVMSHFTHVGVVVYQAPEASEFVYLGPVGMTWNDRQKISGRRSTSTAARSTRLWASRTSTWSRSLAPTATSTSSRSGTFPSERGRLSDFECAHELREVA